MAKVVVRRFLCVLFCLLGKSVWRIELSLKAREVLATGALRKFAISFQAINSKPRHFSSLCMYIASSFFAIQQLSLQKLSTCTWSRTALCFISDYFTIHYLYAVAKVCHLTKGLWVSHLDFFVFLFWVNWFNFLFC